MNGIILVNKPKNLTSHDVVTKIRQIIHFQKVGHFGTLDPLATGLLIIAVGKATRLFPFYLKKEKEYIGKVKFGFSTDTFDCTGRPTSTEYSNYPDKASLLKVMAEFEGEITQIPPRYSAKKYKGRPLYALARKKKEIEVRPQKVFIHAFKLHNYSPPLLDFEVRCTSGTYIRSLAHDIGERLGCPSHLLELTRTRIGSFTLKDCLGLDDIKKLGDLNRVENFLIPLETLLPEYSKIILNEEGTLQAVNGNMISTAHIISVETDSAADMASDIPDENLFRIFSSDGRLLAIAKRVLEKKSLHPFLVINTTKSEHEIEK